MNLLPTSSSSVALLDALYERCEPAVAVPTVPGPPVPYAPVLEVKNYPSRVDWGVTKF